MLSLGRPTWAKNIGGSQPPISIPVTFPLPIFSPLSCSSLSHALHSGVAVPPSPSRRPPPIAPPLRQLCFSSPFLRCDGDDTKRCHLPEPVATANRSSSATATLLLRDGDASPPWRRHRRTPPPPWASSHYGSAPATVGDGALRSRAPCDVNDSGYAGAVELGAASMRLWLLTTKVEEEADLGFPLEYCDVSVHVPWCFIS